MNGWIDSISSFLFHTNAYQCSRTSYALLYCILAVALIISAGGVYMWRRMFVHRRPVTKTNINSSEISRTHH